MKMKKGSDMLVYKCDGCLRELAQQVRNSYAANVKFRVVQFYPEGDSPWVIKTDAAPIGNIIKILLCSLCYARVMQSVRDPGATPNAT